MGHQKTPESFNSNQIKNNHSLGILRVPQSDNINNLKKYFILFPHFPSNQTKTKQKKKPRMKQSTNRTETLKCKTERERG